MELTLNNYVKLTKYVLFPEELHLQLDTFLRYLQEFPYEKPEYCVWCCSVHITPTKFVTNQGIRSYNCVNCKKNFNRLTQTVFARGQHLNKWRDFAVFRLSGFSLLEISHKLALSKNACKIRDKKLMILLQENAPELYQWWFRHQHRQELSLPDQIEAQKNSFRHWLQQQVNCVQVTCPYCHKSHTYHRINEQRPQFRCNGCKKSFNPLQQTPLKKMHFIHLWPAYFDMLIHGLSHKDISAKLGVSKRSLIGWRRNFIKQMQLMKLTELEQWLNWQTKCRISEICREVQKNNRK